MPDDYGYINARVRVMHSGLVTKKLEDAMNAASYGEFLRVLSESSLAPDLGEATAAGAGLTQLDAALSKNFFNTAQKIVGMGTGSAGKDIGLLFARYDLQNLKAVARGKIGGRSSDDILANLTPAGSLKPAVLQALAGTADVANLMGVAGLNASPLAPAFRKAAQALTANNNLLEFEVALDQAYYNTAIKQADSGVLKDYLRREVDAANLLTAMKLKVSNTAQNLESYFVKGGKEVNLARFEQIVGGNGGLDGLNAFAKLSETADLGSAETAVRQIMLENAKKAYIGDALGIGVVLGFLKEKEQEVALARLIGRAKFYNVPTDVIKKEVGRGA
jgi:V/A-type H+/Na+-transporting ATPase subunit C